MIEEPMIIALFNYGPMGIMLGWFMFRMEKVIKNNTDALNRNIEIMANCKLKGGVKNG